MVGRHVKSVAFGLVVVFLSSVLVACTSKPPRAQFVGTPEAVERTPDLELPLKDKDREIIVDFMLNEGRRPLPWWSRSDVDPGLIEDVQEEYGRLLHTLSERAPAAADLEEGGELAKYFDTPEWVLSVHDARVGKDNDGEYYDLDSQRARALVKGDFVFAFYSRRLMPVTVTKDQVPALEPREGTVWVLEDRKGVTYTGLVIFHKHYAIPIGGESR
jgi:hypothetical protein